MSSLPDTETLQVFSGLFYSCPKIDMGASGTFPTDSQQMGVGWSSVLGQPARIYIFPPSGGVVILKADGTWVGDIAPGAG